MCCNALVFSVYSHFNHCEEEINEAEHVMAALWNIGDKVVIFFADLIFFAFTVVLFTPLRKAWTILDVTHTTFCSIQSLVDFSAKITKPSQIPCCMFLVSQTYSNQHKPDLMCFKNHAGLWRYCVKYYLVLLQWFQITRELVREAYTILVICIWAVLSAIHLCNRGWPDSFQFNKCIRRWFPATEGSLSGTEWYEMISS